MKLHKHIAVFPMCSRGMRARFESYTHCVRSVSLWPDATLSILTRIDPLASRVWRCALHIEAATGSIRLLARVLRFIFVQPGLRYSVYEMVSESSRLESRR